MSQVIPHRSTMQQPEPGRRRRVRSGPSASLAAQSEPMLWLAGGALALCVLMIAGLLLLVLVQGMRTFWPGTLLTVELVDGSRVMGEVTRREEFMLTPAMLENMPEPVADRARPVFESGMPASRFLLRTGNYELSHTHFRWVSTFEAISRESRPWATVLERTEWGRFYGEPVALLRGDERIAGDPAAIWNAFGHDHAIVRDRLEERQALEREEIGAVNAKLEGARLRLREVELESGKDSPAYADAQEEFDAVNRWGQEQYARISETIRELNAENAQHKLVMATGAGQEHVVPLDQIVRAVTPNRLSLAGKLAVYGSRWWEYLSEEPREANQEGGVFPAIFGTVLMTLIMSMAVVPFGVLAALYLREYAKAGPMISAVRIAINNLAGVPSIVFGVFGLGFFCYIIGHSIDELLFSERLPNPTFGKGGLLWASLTLALLTLPVVIVATEEALGAVPASMRDGSYACGASKWQTIQRIVLPRALPGIITGMILAIARGAGEVAPLMLVGAVKLAPDLPGEFNAIAPYFHVERSFMHLGFHIYDVGFQSPNAEAAKPMVYTTALLLIVIVAALNIGGILLRSRLRRQFVGNQF